MTFSHCEFVIGHSVSCHLRRSVGRSLKRMSGARFFDCLLTGHIQHGGGHNVSLTQLANLSPIISHFQNDGVTVECSTLVLLLIQLAILCF